MPKGGFKVISIREETYNKIKESAQSRGLPLTTFVGELVETYKPPPGARARPAVDRKYLSAVVYYWPGSYLDFVADPDTIDYKSTAWVVSEEYPDIVGPPQLDASILNRMDDENDEFKMEKMMVISREKAWKKVEIWKWILFWFSMSIWYENKLGFFVVCEEDVPPEIDKKYFDIGIYAGKKKEKEACAFLKLYTGWESDEKKRQYELVYDPSEMDKAKDAFESLKKYAVERSELFTRFEDLFVE